MSKTMAFHSYKGGTGKTSLVVNLGVEYAKQGAKVCVLDYDFRAPSLNVLFKVKPKFWLNDYLEGKCRLLDTLNDFSGQFNLPGKLWVGFSNSSLDALKAMMSKDRGGGEKAFTQTLAGQE